MWNQDLGPPFVGLCDSWDSNANEASNRSWSGTKTWDDGSGDSGSYPISAPPFGPGYYMYSTTQTFTQSTTESDFQESHYEDGDNNGNLTDDIVLSNEYTSQEFTADVMNTLPSAPTVDATNYGLGYPYPIASWNLASDASSFSVETGTYTFNCATTGSNPYVFEWYEVFQPSDNTQPIQATHQEWDNANQQSQSPPFVLNPSTTGTNGTWYIARLDTQTLSNYPECQWRHVIGIGETVYLTLVGLPASISGSATWSFTPSTSGSFGPSNRTTSFQRAFTASRTGTTVTITATFPSNTASSGSTSFSTTFTIEAPTSVTYTKIAPISLPWWGVGAGMWGQYTLLPTNVSFSGCVFQEGKCPSTNPTGFFGLTGKTVWHNPNGKSDYSQPPDNNPEWISIQYDNTAGDLDHAEAGPANLGEAILLEALGPPSGFTWIIPLRYKCQNDTDNGVALPVTVTTTMQIDSDSFVIKNGVIESNGP